MKYTAFFVALKHSQAEGNPFSKEELLLQLTDGRTDSLRDLSDEELANLVSQLNAKAKPPPATAEKADKMRKSIIAIFRSIGKTTPAAIAWAEKQGVNGVKKKFNHYSNQELFRLIRIAEKVKQDHLTVIRNRFLA